MSFRAIIDTIVQAESFRNIDLFEQGLYCVNFSVFHTFGKTKFPGNPCFFHASESSSLVSPAEMDESIFRTRSFVVKYSDDEIDMNDVGVFRSEIELLPGFESTVLTLQVDLLRYPMENFRVKRPEGRIDFKTISTVYLDIRYPLDGVNSFYPVCFGETSFSVMNISVHSLLIDFRYRSTRMQTPIQEIKTSLNTTISSATENIGDFPHLISEYLFGNRYEVEDKDIDRVFEVYANLLHTSYARNKSLVEDIINKCLNESLKEAFLPMAESLENTEYPGTVSDKIASRELEELSEAILLLLQGYSEKLCHLSAVLIEVIKSSPKHVNIHMQNIYNDALKQRWGESTLRTHRQTDSYLIPGSDKTGVEHKNIARTIRKSANFQSIESFPIEQRDFFPKPKWHPILFTDVLSKVREEREEWNPAWISYINYLGFKKRGAHLIVLAHGFQGNSLDVRMIQNHIALIRPDLMLMSSTYNEGKTDGDIGKMGKRLANEVKGYIEEWCPGRNLKKLSFIGHSLGGVIIRAALPHLGMFSDKMHFFLTFSSPHLGYMYNSSKLVDAGMWFLKNRKKNVCLKQLSMNDNKNVKDCFMYKLSQSPGIESFKFVVLVSSFQDTYSPYESSRIEVRDGKRGEFYVDMARYLLERLNCDKIYRIDVNFKIKGQNLDNLIGRAAHIQMLDNNALFMMIFNAFPLLFERD